MKRLLLLILLLSPVFAVTQEVLVVSLTLSNGSVSVSSVDVASGVVSEETGEYTISLLSGETILSSSSFEFPMISSVPLEGFNESLNSSSAFAVVSLPYSSTVSSLRVSKGGEVLLDYSISLCNQDSVCDSGENFFSCFWDCPSGGTDELCDEVFDNVCDPDCVSIGRTDKDPDCTCGDGVCANRENSINCPVDCGEARNELTNTLYLVLGIIGGAITGIIILITLIISIIRKARKKTKPKQKAKRK